MIEKDFRKIIKNIKKDIKSVQIKSAVQVNRNLIMLYFRLGKILYENFEYGNKFIDEISRELKLEYPNATGYSTRNLKYMKKFYLEYKDDEEVQQLVAQVPWGHNILLMEKVDNIEVRKIYLKGIIKNGWGRVMLTHQIEGEYHLRIGNSTNNFKITLPENESDLANYTIKDPYIFDFISLDNNYKELDLENAMLNKIKKLLVELGKGFSFVGNQYKISMNDKDYFIDLLFYHLELRCFVVVELKVTSFKPDYIGQLGFYVTAVDETLKKEFDNPTIGLLLCKEKDKLSVEWSLKGTNLPIGVSSYKLDKYIPKDILDKLPTEEEINLYLDFEEIEENNDICLYIPKLEDYWYEEKIESDPFTMDYNAGYDVTYYGYHYDTGCIDFPKEKWKDVFDKRKEENRYFAYIRNNRINEYVGYVNYQYNKNNNRYECGILIESKYRNKGYSKIALKFLCDAAKNHGIKELYDTFELERSNALKVFEEIGFEIVEELTLKKFGKEVKGVLVKIIL